MSDTVIKLENVSKTFKIFDQSNTLHGRLLGIVNPVHRKIEALKNINLEIKQGELFGIVGRNGSGKSTLLSVMMEAFPPNKGGVVSTKGKIIKLSLGLGFDPKLTAVQNVMINASILGLTIREIKSKLDEIIEFAELEKFKDTKVKFYSSGMKSRLMFAVAIHAKADILLMDEFFGGVGDERFRKKTEELFKNHFIEGKTIVLVSHGMSEITQYCNRAMALNYGECIAIGDPHEVVDKYRQIVTQ